LLILNKNLKRNFKRLSSHCTFSWAFNLAATSRLWPQQL